jgi:hypothetical protein
LAAGHAGEMHAEAHARGRRTSGEELLFLEVSRVHLCPECGQPLSRRSRRAAELAFQVLCLRDQLAQYTANHEELTNLCAHGEDLARHLHFAAHDGVTATPVYTRRAKRWLRDATRDLQGFDPKEFPATWQPLPGRSAAAAPMSEDLPVPARVQISA